MSQCLGVIQVLHNAVGGGMGVSDFLEKALQRSTLQRYEGVGGVHISRKKRYVTLE